MKKQYEILNRVFVIKIKQNNTRFKIKQLTPFPFKKKIGNIVYNGYGKFLGGIGVSIYVDLCRHADNNQKCFPSEKTIAEELRLTDRTIRKYLKLME